MTEPLLVVIYSPFFDQWPLADSGSCSVPCAVTDDRSRLADAEVVIFHLPTLDTVPAVKPEGQTWVAWSMESAVTTPALETARRGPFDLVVSYQRSADVWLPYFGAPSVPTLLTPPAPKDADRPVCHFQSNRYDRSGRTRYAAELLRYLKVASYGTVLPTVSQPGQVVGRDARLAVMARHKFTLAFENSIAADYVSDKFFDPLVAGSVPVYLGAPDIADYAPAARCYLDVHDFAGPRELAAFVNHLDGHDDEYQAYLDWKRDGLSAEFSAAVARVPSRPLCTLMDLVAERRATSRPARRAAPG